jgi:hypothetical protein
MRTVVHDLAVVLLVIFYDYYMLFILDRLLEANYGGKWESLSGPQRHVQQYHGLSEVSTKR